MISSPLKWIGGKAASAQRIIAAFPSPNSYDVYVEPCGGAAHVLLCNYAPAPLSAVQTTLFQKELEK